MEKNNKKTLINVVMFVSAKVDFLAKKNYYREGLYLVI